MSDRDTVGHGNLHAGRLLFDHAHVVYQAIVNGALGWESVTLRSGYLFDLLEVICLAIFKLWISDRTWITHKADPAGAAVMQMATDDFDSAVVLVDEDGIPAELIKFAILDAAIFCILKDDCTTTVDRPVAAQ